VCTNRPISQDDLDQFVWSEIIRLLDDPGLIQAEIDRRREVARNADPLRKREEELRREQVRVEKSSERLVTAYQEGLVTLSQLRQRMPTLQKQIQAVESELQSLKMAAVDESKYLQLAGSLAGFRSKLRVRAQVLDIAVRQQILRLLVKEVLGWKRHDHAAPFDPHSAVGAGFKRIPDSAFRRHRTKAEPRLSFAFGESFRRCWRTSTCTTPSICGFSTGENGQGEERSSCYGTPTIAWWASRRRQRRGRFWQICRNGWRNSGCHYTPTKRG
jgi:hypothetical protein